jgi:hypothetical protein
MKTPTEGTPEFYRDQARRIRELAEAATTGSIREQLLEVARQYESLADHAELRKKPGRQ